MFGDNKKRPAESPAPEPVAAPAKKETASWDDGLSGANPKRSSYFNKIRSEAYMNHNLVENFVEFWAAIQVDVASDKWRVMHYMVSDLDSKDGKFVSEQVTKNDVPFAEAVAMLAKQEYIAAKMLTHKEVNLEQDYPAAKFPELKIHFYDLEHYKKAANIEGLAFDEYNAVYRRVEGMITAHATFKRTEVVKSILAAEQASDNPLVKAKMEAGILTDLMVTASDRAATLDNILKIGQVLNTMDEFAAQVGAFYLAIQKGVKRDEKFDRIEGLKPEEKNATIARAQTFLPSNLNENNAFPKILEQILPQMNQQLQAAKQLGVHVEPFQKFAAECEIYANLLYASRNRGKLEQGFVNVNNTDANLITEIRASVDRANKKFLELGGTKEQMDKLQAWVADTKKDPVPNWLPGFLTRYYTERAKVMQKVQDRNAGVRHVATMPVDVKPPVTNEFNETSAPTGRPVRSTPQPAATNDDTPPSPESLDKFKNVMNRPPKP